MFITPNLNLNVKSQTQSIAMIFFPKMTTVSNLVGFIVIVVNFTHLHPDPIPRADPDTIISSPR